MGNFEDLDHLSLFLKTVIPLGGQICLTPCPSILFNTMVEVSAGLTKIENGYYKFLN
jgi:hypothetical protein